jgi:group II intron reverse transcriptase/maturase
VNTKLERIAQKARSDGKLRFTSLAHLLTPEFLTETWQQMNRAGASGVDGETTREFERELGTRVVDLVERLKARQYRPAPVRRVEIPKGNGKMRPLGIPTIEDRLLQRAVARILGAIYEQDFLECSYGFRQGRNAHQALGTLRNNILFGRVGYVYEADIRGYFDHVNHEWLQKMVGLRVADPVIVSLVGKWLRAGVMNEGVVVRTEEGTPQGGPISPVLANIYLHHVLDLWFERRFKKECRGEAYLVRFADDFVACFQYKQDVEAFDRQLPERMRKFGLELAPEKTRMMLFGRFARSALLTKGRKPESFEFLGFKHVCGIDRQGRAAVIRIPSQKSCRRFLDRTREWLRRHMHWKRRRQQVELTSKLRGFYLYFALSHCKPKLQWIRKEVRRQWRKALMHRSQRHRLYWSHLSSQAWFELPQPRTLHATI